MANYFTNLLNSLTDNQTNFKDYQHANRLFIQNYYRLAPKFPFLYFVRFRLHPAVSLDDQFTATKQDLELGMLVSKCDLPSVSFENQTMNQYNQKVPVYTKLTYNPVTMQIHDDNAGLVRHFWQSYYQYYAADSWYGGDNAVPGTLPNTNINRYQQRATQSNPQLASRANPAAASYINTTDPSRYGLDSGKTIHMIQSIEIYQFARKTFFMWTLNNPIITQWKTDSVESAGVKPMSHQVTFAYESMYFGKGRVRAAQPDGWTSLHYDLDPSPIGGLFGRTDGTLLGPYGLIADATQFFADIQDNQINGSPTDFRTQIQIALEGIKVIGQASSLNTAAASAELSRAFQQGISNSVVSAALGTTGIPGLNISRVDLSNPTNLAQSIATSVQSATPTIPGT